MPAKIKNRWLGGRRLCTDCDQHLDPAEFSVKKSASDGLSHNCKACAWDYQLRTKYGVTAAQYNKMLADQDGRCAICGTDKCPSGRRLAVDHDHNCCPGAKTCGNCVRQLLCQHCNQAICLMRDNPELLRKAAGYIEENR